MIFEPGCSYYELDASQMEQLQALLTEFELDYDLVNDFQPADNGKYYVLVGSSALSEDELEFMGQFGFDSVIDYKKSTQSTSPI